MISRLTTLGLAAASVVLAGPGAAPVIGTISSSMPIAINGTEMLPTAAPSWPLVDKDEVSTEGPALLHTVNRDDVTFGAQTRARISTTGNGFEYIYVREGGLQFDASQGPVFVCIGGRLYVPNKSAKGTLRLNQSQNVAASLEKGTFAEQGARPCGADFSASYLTGLPKAAGGAAGGGIGGTNAGNNVAIGVAAGAVVGAGLGALGMFNSSSPNSCTSSSGCNFNPPPISPSSP